MIRETIVPAIPDVRPDNVAEVLRAIKSTMDVREGSIGDPLDQMVTLRELAALNIVESGGSTTTPFGTSLPVIPVLPPIVSNYNPATDLTTPPAPSNLRARGGFTNVFLEWDGAPYRNHGYTEIWRSQTDNLGTAVLVGTTAASVYGDPVSPDTTYFYWIRFVSAAAITGPYNSTSGTQATTAIDVSQALAALSSEITSSQLFVDLGSRIGAVETQANLTSGQIAVLQEARAQFDAQIARTGSAILTTQKITSSQATQITQLGTRVGTSESNITQLFTTTATQATALTQLSSTVGGNTTSIQTLTTTTNGLSGQYTVKIDNNGHVSGFGLASTTTTAGPTSAFIVRADRFAIVGANDTTDPLGTVNPTKVPFIVLTTPTTVNGKTYPAGTWIDTAFIANATITTAQITSLTADKITAGSVTAALGLSTGKIFGGVAVSTNINDGTYGNLLYPFASANFGTGFFLGLDSSVYKFYVGSPSQNMNWNGSALTVTGNINATSGSFRNITIYDSFNNVIMSAGSSVSSSTFNGNVTGYVAGTDASTVVNTANTAYSTANTANSTANTANSTANSANSTANTANSTANSANSTANAANSTANSALSTANAAYSGLATKLNSDSRNVLAGSGGLATGNLSWDSSGNRVGGYGVGLTQKGLVAYNSSGAATFVLDGTTGSATFAGALSAATGTFAGSLSAATGTFSGNLSAAGGTFTGTLSGVNGTFSGNLTAQTITTDNIVGQAVTTTYSTSTSGNYLPQTVSVPSGCSAVVILVGLGAGAYSSGGESGGTYYPVVGDLVVNGATVVNNSSGAIVWSIDNPPAGSYPVSASRTSFTGNMTMAIIVSKR